jgi:hemoglobin-like flavoprotein
MKLTLDHFQARSPLVDARYPVVGAAALDLMAAIAGPTAAPDHARAWSAAFEIVTRALVAQRPRA